jgi:hypothetical protein
MFSKNGHRKTDRKKERKTERHERLIEMLRI